MLTEAGEADGHEHVVLAKRGDRLGQLALPELQRLGKPVLILEHRCEGARGHERGGVAVAKEQPRLPQRAPQQRLRFGRSSFGAEDARERAPGERRLVVAVAV